MSETPRYITVRYLRAYKVQDFQKPIKSIKGNETYRNTNKPRGIGTRKDSETQRDSETRRESEIGRGSETRRNHE